MKIERNFRNYLLLQISIEGKELLTGIFSLNYIKFRLKQGSLINDRFNCYFHDFFLTPK